LSVGESIWYAGDMKKILQIYVRVVLLSMPLFFWPWSTDAIGFGKVTWLILTGGVGLVWWALMMVIEKQEKFRINSLWLLMLALTGWGGYSFCAKIPIGVQTRTLMEPVGMGLLAGVTIWAFLWLQVKDGEEVKRQWNWLTVAGVVTAMTSLMVFLIPAAKLPLLVPKDNPILIVGAGWSLTGSLLAEVVFLTILVVEWGGRMLKKLKMEGGNYIGEAVLTIVLGLVIMVDLYRIVKFGWIIMDGTSAWVIAVESLKRSPIFGIGVGTYLEGFMALRPASYNLTKYWSMNFGQSSMGLLQLWTELGLVGLGIVLIGVGLVVTKGRKLFGGWTEIVKALVILAVILLLPPSLLVIFLGMWGLMGFIKNDWVISLKLRVGETGFNVAPVVVLMGLVMALVGTGCVELGVVKGEYYYRNSMLAASKNDGSGAYNMQIKAIASNPNMADYRRSYSQTNMALAVNLLQAKDISDEDKQKASVLVQQSVREAKAAVSLDSFNADYWTNLAVIYRQIVGLLDGAADWSLQAYQQTTALDPVNPLVKLDMGGLLFAAKNYEAADRVFEQVVTVKSDFANGWYNWAHTAKNMNKLADAVQRMTQAVKLVAKDSEDYKKANRELEDWTKEYNDAVKKATDQQKAVEAAKATLTPVMGGQSSTGTLRTSEPLPTMGKEEKVKVPVEDLKPMVSPTPGE
jgi:Tfp pilus assembly protein PilF